MPAVVCDMEIAYGNARVRTSCFDNETAIELERFNGDISTGEHER